MNKDKNKPIIMGVAGGTSSGKTGAVKYIKESLGDQVTVISQDSYYKKLFKEQKENVTDYNFDHPDALEWSLLKIHLDDLKQGKTIEKPKYCFVTHDRLSETETVYPSPIIIVEGTLIFYDDDLANVFDLKIYVDTETETRKKRRIARDQKERGRSLESILVQWNRFVEPSHIEFVESSRKKANITLHNNTDVENFGSTDIIWLNVLLQWIKAVLKEKQKSF